jgi:C4-type Zn-finger protein
MFGTEKTKIPVVICPGCDEPMKAMERKEVAFSNGLVDVTYVCETCHTHIIRTVKPDGKGLL